MDRPLSKNIWMIHWLFGREYNALQIIICTGSNPKFTDVALSYGFSYGIVFPGKAYSQVYFADQNWKKPQRAKYMEALSIHQPVMATVLDLEYTEQFQEVLDWAEEASQYVKERVIIIPKVKDLIRYIPLKINSKDVVLGYSVPSKYGKTGIAPMFFHKRMVHLLGGNPFQQKYYQNILCKEVVSIDGNYISKMATRFCQFFYPKGCFHARNVLFPTLREFDGVKYVGNGPLEAFTRSCESLKGFWDDISGSIRKRPAR